ncbi:SEC-C motif-containing protein [Ereboglobus sp. PH5-5]|uniref:YchJ family protein n=1 Tax=unclassified Ereboglobus TaxID=2626932 RepID=UPI0024049198|nr:MULTISPECIES: YchJ family metal-binding protein [unclassified Ereboglobus]MDF9828407.1 SEC-C motif-containing protein [Ereboglobus sp. PH5-10]MDF9834297.1 SEC-C motif-containing protein [Ereboglobus sp. PH5-5]
MTTPAALPADITSESPCPCGSGQTFGACCQPVLQRKRPAATAEALMRSRFTAHVVRDYKHLHLSYAGTAKKPYDEVRAKENTYDLEWTRLVIHSHEAVVNGNPDSSTVEFTAYFLDEEKNEHPLQEKSAFTRTGGEWIYTRPIRTGPAPKVSATPKVGRNDPCPCGSGKKYKHCCL